MSNFNLSTKTSLNKSFLATSFLANLTAHIAKNRDMYLLTL